MEITTLQLLGAFALSYVGFAWLALTQLRPWRAVGLGRRRPTRTRLVRVLGVVSLSLGLALTLARDGLAFGLLVWPLLLAIAATAVAITLTWRPQWLRGLARFLPDATE
ncbi:MAG: DUF3325 domain-containing protein [Myxococcota bacterium]